MDEGNSMAESGQVTYLLDPVIPVWVYVLWFASQLGEGATEQQVFVETSRHLNLHGHDRASIASVEYAVKALQSKGLLEVSGQVDDEMWIPARVHLKVTSQGHERLDGVWDVIHDTHTLLGGSYF